MVDAVCCLGVGEGAEKEKKVRLPSIKSLQTVLEVCRAPALLDVILEMPMSFIGKCLHLLKGAKASRGDFGIVGQLALSRSVPGGIVAECGELLANGGLSRGAGVKDIGVVLALKHRWCEDWLIDTLKRLVAKADVPTPLHTPLRMKGAIDSLDDR